MDSKFNQGRWRFAVNALFALLMAGAGVAHAQIKHNDYTELNSNFSTSSAMPVMISPEQSAALGITSNLNSKFVGQAPNLNQFMMSDRASLPPNTFSKSMSALNGQMSNTTLWQKIFSQGSPYPIKMAPAANMRDPQMNTSLLGNSSLNDYTEPANWKPHDMGPAKFTDSFVLHTGEQYSTSQIQQMEQELDLSMRDVNRYQFPGSKSSDPGLLITHAAGNTEDVSIKGGGLFNLPSLFDSGSIPTPASRARSGDSIAPKLLTADGSVPYLLTRENSPSSTSLTNMPSGGSTTTSRPSQSGKSTSGSTLAPLPAAGGYQGDLKDVNRIWAPAGTYTHPDNGVDVPIQVGAPEASATVN